MNNKHTQEEIIARTLKALEGCTLVKDPNYKQTFIVNAKGETIGYYYAVVKLETVEEFVSDKPAMKWYTPLVKFLK